ncbi:MAG TPA: hypothetical protein VG892_03805, partial [Terriglobales bacterium]|nr:hypothetical protein [Terriglobales bacterium]
MTIHLLHYQLKPPEDRIKNGGISCEVGAHKILKLILSAIFLAPKPAHLRNAALGSRLLCLAVLFGYLCRQPFLA